MSLVQRVPEGLLGLLGVKNLGRTPNEGSEEVRTVIDTTAMYAANIGLEFGSSEATVPFASPGGFAAGLNIPDGETWLVVSVTAEVQFSGIGQSARICPMMLEMPRGVDAAINGDDRLGLFTYANLGLGLTSAKNGESAMVGGLVPQPLVVRAPVRFGCYIMSQAAAANLTYAIKVSYYNIG